MTGVDVATLQQYLNALGYMPKHVTGVFDDETKNAVIEFQKIFFFAEVLRKLLSPTFFSNV